VEEPQSGVAGEHPEESDQLVGVGPAQQRPSAKRRPAGLGREL
jgi:hypothetical protein